MPNALKAYVRRTILEAARDGSPTGRRTRESTRVAFTDAMRGTDTGWWHDLIYTAPMLDMAHRYRRDIAAALGEYRDATGEHYQHRDGDGESIALALLRGPYSFEQYKSEKEGGPADMSLLGLRFAVEWFAGELAREYCPDLYPPLSVEISETARPGPAPVAGKLAAPRLMSWPIGVDNMMHETTTRDRTRRPDAKRRAMTRKSERIAKSARLFLAFVFPPQLTI